MLIQLGSYIRSCELRSNPINQASTEFYQFAIRNIQRTVAVIVVLLFAQDYLIRALILISELYTMFKSLKSKAFEYN